MLALRYSSSHSIIFFILQLFCTLHRCLVEQAQLSSNDSRPAPSLAPGHGGLQSDAERGARADHDHPDQRAAPHVADVPAVL